MVRRKGTPNFNKDMRSVSVMIDPDDYEKLADMATKEERSVAYLVRKSVKDFVASKYYSQAVDDAHAWVSTNKLIKGDDVFGQEFRKFLADEMKRSLGS